MSIQSEITRLNTNVTNALSAISGKGVTVPADANSDDLAGLIGQIEAGGSGGGTTAPFEIYANSSLYLMGGSYSEVRVRAVVSDENCHIENCIIENLYLHAAPTVLFAQMSTFTNIYCAFSQSACNVEEWLSRFDSFAENIYYDQTL